MWVKVPEKFSGDTLIISSIGYKTVKKRLLNTGNNETINLEPAVIQLKEVTVQGESALDLIKRVLIKIPENYDTSNYHMMAFYQENIMLGDFQLNNSEAVLDIFKTFKTEKNKPTDQIMVMKGRKKNIDYSSDFRLYLWIKNFANGARNSVAQDVIKYRLSDSNPINPKNFRYYNFEYGDALQSGDRNFIVINILPKKNSRKAMFTVKLFIDEESLAIAKSSWELTKSGIRSVERQDKGVAYAIMSTAVATNLDYHKFQADILYQQYKGKWYLSSVTRNLEMLVNSKKRNMDDRPWVGNMNLQITDIDLQNQNPITEGNIGDTQASMETLVGNNPDEAFWENFNIVKPVIPDSLKKMVAFTDTASVKTHSPAAKTNPSHKNNTKNFTRADTLRGKLSPMRSCYDVSFYHLDVEVDMNQRSVKGNNLIRFKVKEPFQVMQIDLYANMNIEKILFKNQLLHYTREFDAVFVHLPEVLKSGDQSEIKIYYEGIPKTPDWAIPMNGGILWDKDEAGNLWAQVVCQGSGASLWWPNKDHLSDEPDSMKIWITVPSAFTEISNGRLIQKTNLPDERTRYEWLVSYPINNYNVTFNIGKYEHFRDLYITTDTLTLDYYVMPYNRLKADSMFQQVKPMLTTFEKYFGKYPFPRDGFTLVESLYQMEHQSGVCIGKITKENSGETNPLLWHESAHEWWGNAISCTDMADMWLHEAFATYAEALVIEDKFGKEQAHDFIFNGVSAMVNQDPIIGARDVNNIFYNIEDMYSKGSLVLHTFRNVLNNDTLWFELLRGIQNRFRYQTLTSDQLINYINDKTQTDYTYFFDQYLKYTNLPKLEFELKMNGVNLTLNYRWITDVKNFRMPLKITTAPEKFNFIYPETSWKTIVIKNMDESQFEIDEESFLITVIEKER